MSRFVFLRPLGPLLALTACLLLTLSCEKDDNDDGGDGGGEGSGPPTMITVPAGTYMMGQAGVATPEHEVTLTHSFELSQTEITNAQYMEALQWAYDHPELTGVSATADTVQAYGVELLDLDATRYCEIAFNPGTQQFYLAARTFDSGHWGPGFAYHSGNYDPGPHPVKCVSWFGAACYCDWLSLMEGLPAYYNGQWSQTPIPNEPYIAAGYRLPTEAEWEYAAQFGDERVYPWGDSIPSHCVHANFDNCLGWTAPVGSHPDGDSELGLQDMSGNVLEWCNDWYVNYSAGAISDPPGPSEASRRVLRGGYWYVSSYNVLSAIRYYYDPASMYYQVGFRICKTN